MRVAFISASLGNLDKNLQDRHVPQALPEGVTLDFFYYDSKNFPLRVEAMMPRLQAKIPKMLGWELQPGYDAYIWSDAVITLSNPQAVSWLLDQLGTADIALFRHQDNRKGILQELTFMQAHMRGVTGNEFARNYLNSRYASEPMVEQVAHYLCDPEFKDDHLYSGGLFIYRNNDRMRHMLSEWFLHNCRYSVQDQLSLPYLLWKCGCTVNVIDAEITNNEFTEYYWRDETNAHKWDAVYRRLPAEPSAWIYGDTCTYKMGADWLADCQTVEDWGTGAGGFKRFRKDAVGVDGSQTPYADFQADLASYTSRCEGVFLRHVLEHNREWKQILRNVLASASKKAAIVLFTPLSDAQTVELSEGTEENKRFGISVPTLSLGRKAMLDIISGCASIVSMQTVATNTRYGQETVLLIRSR